MSAPRGLTPEEAAAWARVAATVRPLRPQAAVPPAEAAPVETIPPSRRDMIRGVGPQAGQQSAPFPKPPPNGGGLSAPATLDSTWDRKLARGTVAPDVTLDLHGHTLDTAYSRLMDGLAQARAIGARTVLLVTGKPRPAEAADRAHSRGAIRAKVLDWLAASSHSSAIAAIRKAHPRHGGEGALYLIFKRGI